MELSPWDTEDYIIGRTIMVPEKNGLYSFYKIIKITNKIFYVIKMKHETKLIKTIEDKENQILTRTYEAIISKEIDNEGDKINRRIKKENITNYSITLVSIVQYEV